MSPDLLHSFPSQEKNEAVFVFARPYWFAFLPSIFIFLFIFVSTAVAQIYTTTVSDSITPYLANIIILALSTFQLIGLIVFLVAILDFYFDIIVVTDRRLVDIDQEQLFYRKISELNLRDVEDVSFSRSGFFQTYLDYGTVDIQTAGERSNFSIQNLRFPSEITAIISDLANKAKSDEPEEKRLPEGLYIGVIENERITDPADLVLRGAMLPTDIRRIPRQ